MISVVKKYGLCKVMSMKKYEIVASKEVVAEFTMDLQVFEMRFGLGSKLAKWIVSQHGELEGSTYDWKYTDNTVVIKFYSVGNLVINEK